MVARGSGRGESALSCGRVAQGDRSRSRRQRGGGQATDGRGGHHRARRGDLRHALRLRHRRHLLGSVAAHRGIQPHPGLEADGRRQHLARRRRRGTDVQLAFRSVRSARHIVDAGSGVHRRRAVVRRRVRFRCAVAGTAGPGVRGRRGDADGTDVRRRALSACLPGTVGAVLPNRHRGGPFHRCPRRALRLDLLARGDRNRVRTRRDHAVAVAATPGKSALAGQARTSKRCTSRVGACPARRLRRGRRTGRSDRTRARRTHSHHPRVARAARRLGAPGPGPGVRDRGVHPAQRHRDDHLLFPDHLDQRRRVQVRGSAGVGGLGGGVPDRPAGRGWPSSTGWDGAGSPSSWCRVRR